MCHIEDYEKFLDILFQKLNQDTDMTNIVWKATKKKRLKDPYENYPAEIKILHNLDIKDFTIKKRYKAKSTAFLKDKEVHILVYKIEAKPESHLYLFIRVDKPEKKSREYAYLLTECTLADTTNPLCILYERIKEITKSRSEEFNSKLKLMDNYLNHTKSTLPPVNFKNLSNSANDINRKLNYRFLYNVTKSLQEDDSLSKKILPYIETYISIDDSSYNQSAKYKLDNTLFSSDYASDEKSIEYFKIFLTNYLNSTTCNK